MFIFNKFNAYLLYRILEEAYYERYIHIRFLKFTIK